MKKLLTVSLVAMMAVTTARAEIASKAYVDQREAAAVSTANTYTDTKIGNIGDNADVAAAIAAAVQSGTDNAVTHTGAVGNATTPIYVTEQGVATAGTALGTASTKNAASAITDGSDDLVSGDLVHDALALKADASSLGTMAAANTDDYYTKTAADAAFDAAGDAAAAETAAKTYADGKFQTLANKTTDLSGTFADDTEYPSAKAVKAAISSASAPTNFISQTITDAVTDKAPSENAVFDALAQKQGLIGSTVDNDGQYVLTADLSGGVMTNYRWELVQRATSGEHQGE